MSGCPLVCLSAHWRGGDTSRRGQCRRGGPGGGYRAAGRRAVDAGSARAAGAPGGQWLCRQPAAAGDRWAGAGGADVLGGPDGGQRAAVDFAPPTGAVWRMGGQWAPELIVGHNDAAPYNAVWRDGGLAGFIDWDMAGPVTAVWDVAFAAFSWVPLHARHVVAREGFTDFEGRPRRLQLFLAEYGWTGPMPAFLEVVAARIRAHVTSLRGLAAHDPLFARIVAQGAADNLETALAELAHFT